MKASPRKWMVTVALGCAMVAGVAIAARYWQRRHAFTPLTVVAVQPTSAPVSTYSPFQRNVLAELQRQVHANIKYRDAYYVGGEPPAREGVCTDVVIRAYRAAGVDIRERMAQDVRESKSAYHITRPDPNIDQRRCRCLIVFFRRHARELPGNDWQPGDVVFWDTYGDGRVDHVGMVGSAVDARGEPAIIHHWPGLPVSETDGLSRYRIMGHFRWPSPR